MDRKQWEAKYGKMKTADNGCLYVMVNNEDRTSSACSEMRWDLFHLTDYAVSSVCGDTHWMVKRAA